MSKVVVRRILISERDFPRLKHHCLVCSEYGNTQLYDTCEWQPITTHDLLLFMLKHSKSKSINLYMRHYESCSYQWYKDYRFYFDDNGQLIGYKKHSRYPVVFGWATVTKDKTIC